MALSPVPKQTLADAVEAKIRAHIRASGLRPGDPLPAEKEFAQQLDVSRNVVREALSRLRMQGLVRSKKRQGMVLAHPDLFSGFSRLLETGVLDAEVRRNLMELRLVIERGIAELVCARVQPVDVTELEKIAMAYKAVPAADQDARLACDAQFHARLYRISGNQELAAFQALLMPFFQQAVREQRHLVQPRPAPGGDHQDLVEALRNRSAEAFRRAMILHLQHHVNAFAKERSHE